MLQALATTQDRLRTLILLGISGAAAVAAFLVGIDDNLPGILLALAAAVTLVLAFVHPWRSTREFRRLFLASVLGFLLLAVLHNIFDAFAGTAEHVAVLHDLLEVLGGLAFIVATLLCPAALLVSIVALVVLVGNRPQLT
jgi:hypothetical protein